MSAIIVNIMIFNSLFNSYKLSCMQAQEKEWLAGWLACLAKMTATAHQGSLLAVLLTATLIMTALLFAPVSCNVVYVSNTTGNKSCHGYHRYNLTCPSLNLALSNGIFT